MCLLETQTHIQNNPAMIIIGSMFILIFGFLLSKNYISHDFSKEGKILFLLDNYKLIGGIFLGIGLLFIALLL